MSPMSPGQYLAEVMVGLFKMNSSVFGSKVAVVSRPYSLLMKMNTLTLEP